MSTPQERIETEVKQALKAGDKERLSTLRMLLNAIKNERIRTGQEVDESTFLKLVRKGIKQRQESSQLYRQGGRQELAEQEEREAAIRKSIYPRRSTTTSWQLPFANTSPPQGWQVPRPWDP